MIKSNKISNSNNSPKIAKYRSFNSNLELNKYKNILFYLQNRN